MTSPTFIHHVTDYAQRETLRLEYLSWLTLVGANDILPKSKPRKLSPTGSKLERLTLAD